MDYLSPANNLKIHVSKSNPNLINNEIQFVVNSEAAAMNDKDLSAPNTVLQPESPNLGVRRDTNNQLNVSNNSLMLANSFNNDENAYKANFYQAAKSSLFSV